MSWRGAIVSTASRASALVGVLVASAVATGCSSAAAGGPAPIRVVASTDVWGDVARQVAGPLAGSGVRITSVIDDPDADPHDYEANARDELAVSRAQLLVINGGGYDPFVASLRRSTRSSAPVVDAVAIAGPEARSNEHVFYDLPVVVRVARRIAAELSAIDPAHASTYRAGAAGFATEVGDLRRSETRIAAAHRGTAVLTTEALPGYLVAACGLVDRADPQFRADVEDGNGVPTALLAHTVRLLENRRVALLAYNAQTYGPETALLRTAARRSRVPTVGLTETLPPNTTYLAWMRDAIAAVDRALR